MLGGKACHLFNCFFRKHVTIMSLFRLYVLMFLEPCPPLGSSLHIPWSKNNHWTSYPEKPVMRLRWTIFYFIFSNLLLWSHICQYQNTRRVPSFVKYLYSIHRCSFSFSIETLSTEISFLYSFHTQIKISFETRLEAFRMLIEIKR